MVQEGGEAGKQVGVLAAGKEQHHGRHVKKQSLHDHCQTLRVGAELFQHLQVAFNRAVRAIAFLRSW